jgi:hypothetical protein
LLPSGTTYERAADQIEPPPKEPSASGRFGAACLPSKSLPKLSRGQSRSALSLNSPRAPSSHSSASATVRAPPYRRLRHSVVPVAAKRALDPRYQPRARALLLGPRCCGFCGGFDLTAGVEIKRMPAAQRISRNANHRCDHFAVQSLCGQCPDLSPLLAVRFAVGPHGFISMLQPGLLCVNSLTSDRAGSHSQIFSCLGAKALADIPTGSHEERGWLAAVGGVENSCRKRQKRTSAARYIQGGLQSLAGRASSSRPLQNFNRYCEVQYHRP